MCTHIYKERCIYKDSEKSGYSDNRKIGNNLNRINICLKLPVKFDKMHFEHAVIKNAKNEEHHKIL